MTSPVETDLRGWSRPDDSSEGWTMSFLYRNPTLGPVGDDGRVKVRDTDPVQVVSIGLQGAYGDQTVQRGLAKLNEWLNSQQDWIQDGDPRALYYNGPSIPDVRKWAEIQIPVRRVDARSSDAEQMRTKPNAKASAIRGDAHSARVLIELAIARGVPLFNNGQPAACAAVYEVAAQALLALNPEPMTDQGRQTLQSALDTVRTESDAQVVAWNLRSALDLVFVSLADRHTQP